MEKRTVVLIPARYASCRYPGKPLANLAGKPMIIWVAELSSRAVGKDNVYVVTDDNRIADVVNEWRFNVIMTGYALTGTDRVALAAETIDADIILNVQGDEPLLNPEDIVKIRKSKEQNPHCVINGFCFMGKNENPNSLSIPKVITTEDNDLVYISRMPIPGFKSEQDSRASFKKQVCIYAFTKYELKRFLDFGRKSELERYEDVEILRFLELDIKVKMVETNSGSLAVDSPGDLEPVATALREIHNL